MRYLLSNFASTFNLRRYNVDQTLHVTRKSRKHHKKRSKPIVYEYEPLQARGGIGRLRYIFSRSEL
jgi:hypothetical protein